MSQMDIYTPFCDIYRISLLVYTKGEKSKSEIGARYEVS